MLQSHNRFMSSRLIVVGLFLIFATAVAAQNQSHTVEKRSINFRAGRTSAVVRGKADYAMSYVYTLQSRHAQRMTIRLSSAKRHATFSLVAPDGETLENGFGVTSWSGELVDTGEYTIVVVMNNEAARRVPYKLTVSIR